MSNTKLKLKLSCWNVRTLLDRAESNRPERRTALIAQQLRRYNIELAALSETRLSDKSNLKEHGLGYTFYWIGKPEGEKRESGVGFAIRKDVASHLEELPCGVSYRIMTLQLPL